MRGLGKKFLQFVLIFTLTTGWIFSGWPPIWENPRIPPEVKLAHAAIVIQNDGGPTVSKDTQAPTFSLNVASGATMVVVMIMVRNTETISSVTDSNGDTYVAAIDSSGNAPKAAIYYSISPTVNASKTITVNFSASTADSVIGGFSLTGTETSSPIDATLESTNTSTGPSTAITTNSADSLIVWSVGVNRDITFSSYGTGQVERYQAKLGGPTKFAGLATSEITTSAGANTQSATISRNQTWRGVAAEIKIAPSPVTTIADGTDPSNSTIAPGAAITDLDAVTFVTNVDTDSVTALTVTLGTGDSDNLSEVRITSDNGSTLYFSAISTPASDTLNFSGGTAIPVTNSSVQFKIRITPETHTNMPAPAGAEYAITGTVTSFTSTNSQAGSDSGSATITIDNLSPGNTTSNSGSAGDTEVTINYTTPSDTDLNSVVVLRDTSTVTDNPVEGATYSVGNTIGTAVVACVDTTVSASTADSCTDTGLTNDTAYYYEIFAKDSNGNYATGIVPSGSPFTPSSAPVYSVSITSSGSIEYGFVAVSTASSTVGNGYTQTAQNDGNTTEKLNVKSSDATGGTTWTLASAIDSNTFKHEFSTTTGATWTVMPDNVTYVLADPSVAVSGTVTFDFQLTSPSTSSDYQQKSITITIQAVAP